jgi:hypothetical protein
VKPIVKMAFDAARSSADGLTLAPKSAAVLERR